MTSKLVYRKSSSLLFAFISLYIPNINSSQYVTPASVPENHQKVTACRPPTFNPTAMCTYSCFGTASIVAQQENTIKEPSGTIRLRNTEAQF